MHFCAAPALKNAIFISSFFLLSFKIKKYKEIVFTKF